MKGNCMKLFGHLGWKLGALALTGGTAVMLFNSTGVSTDFTATTSGTIGAKGATVNVASNGGTFNVSNLIPGGPKSPAQTVVFTNNGTVPEAFNFIIGTIKTDATGFTYSNDGLPTGTDPLTQMEIVITANNAATYTELTGQPASSTYSPIIFPPVPLSEITTVSGVVFSPNTGTLSISNIPPQHLATVPVGGSVNINIQFELAADGTPTTPPNPTNGTVGTYGNDWNNAYISIPYMLQAQAGGNATGSSSWFEPSSVLTPTVN